MGTTSFTGLANGTYTVTVQAVPSDVTLATGTNAYSTITTVSDLNVSSGAVEYVLTFTSSTMQKNSTDYSGGTSWTTICSDKTYTLVNFANNNKGWDYVQAGAKKAKSSDATKVTTGTITTEKISESIKTVTVDVTLNRGSATAKLYIASDKDFTSDLQTVDYGTVKTEKMKLTVPAAAKNQYYKLEFECSNTTTTNGVIKITSVTFTEGE